jgi:hypothetical protein
LAWHRISRLLIFKKETRPVRAEAVGELLSKETRQESLRMWMLRVADDILGLALFDDLAL